MGIKNALLTLVSGTVCYLPPVLPSVVRFISGTDVWGYLSLPDLSARQNTD